MNENQIRTKLGGINIAFRHVLSEIDANNENESLGDMTVNPQRVPLTGDIRERWTTIYNEVKELIK